MSPKHRADGNVTIDQFIADEVGRQTRFPSITVGSEGGIHGGCQLSWTKSGVRVPPITGPAELFDKLFVSEPKHKLAERARANNLQRFHPRFDSWTSKRRCRQEVNHEDRDKLDEYFSSIRDVEKRLASRRQVA